MKKCLSLSLVFLMSCSHLSPEKKTPVTGLEAMLSAEDLKIHQCLHAQGEVTMQVKKECLKGTQYDGLVTRVPSESDNEIIMKNNWFFGDQSKLNQFYQISRGFVRASAKYVKVATNDRGVGVDGSAFFGVGRGWLAEVVNHHGHIGLFCAPYVAGVTDIGVAATLSVVQSISCPSNHAYEGGFLQIGVGISAEAIGLPVDLSAAYSFGLDLPGFAQRIRASRSAGKLKITNLSREIARLAEPAIKRGLSGGNNGYAAMMNVALRPLSVLGLRVPSVSTLRAVNTVVKDAILHHRSLGAQFKTYHQRYLANYLQQQGLVQLKEFFSILTASMSGCDSVGGAAGLSLTLSPVELNIQYQNYALLMEMQFEDLRALKVLTPMALLNPFLMGPEDLRAVSRVARGVLSIPVKVPRMCNTLFPRI